MAALDHARETLKVHWRILGHQWSVTREVWRDEVRNRFEKEFWSDFSQVVPQTLDELERLDGVLGEVRRRVH